MLGLQFVGNRRPVAPRTVKKQTTTTGRKIVVNVPPKKTTNQPDSAQ